MSETYRREMRARRKKMDEMYMEYASEKKMLFSLWVRSLTVDEDYARLRETFLEAYAGRILGEMRTYPADKKVETMQSEAELCDVYANAHTDRKDT